MIPLIAPGSSAALAREYGATKLFDCRDPPSREGFRNSGGD
jgi:hypothetical protein